MLSSPCAVRSTLLRHARHKSMSRADVRTKKCIHSSFSKDAMLARSSLACNTNGSRYARSRGTAIAAAKRTGIRKHTVGSCEAGRKPQYSCSRMRMKWMGSTTRSDERGFGRSNWIWGVSTPASTTRIRAYLVRVMRGGPSRNEGTPSGTVICRCCC